MTIVFDEAFHDSAYADDNASLPGRMEAAMRGIRARTVPWRILAPEPASTRQLLLAHEPAWVEKVAVDQPRYAMARLAAGAALLAARLAAAGEPAFACLRPPGHHASRSGAWGHCTFNNLAIALLALRDEGLLRDAFVIDIDHHTGDGTREILGGIEGMEVFNPFAEGAARYLGAVEDRLAGAARCGILAVSAGFDAYRLDLGGKLDTADFRRIGELLRDASKRLCGGKRFAVLEGGYYLADLGANIAAFCEGFA